MKIVHPVADEWTEEYAVFVAAASSVHLTEPLAAFLDYAKTEQLRPVLLTQVDTQLSPFVSLAMHEAGGFWAAQRPDGAVFNALSGFRVSQFSELWYPDSAQTQRLPNFDVWAEHGEGVLLFDVYVHQRAAAETQIGNLAQSLVQSLGGSPLEVTGDFEPLADPWDTTRLTEHFRQQMPVSEKTHAAAQDHSYCDIAVGRTPRGVLEHAKGGVPLGVYPTTITDVVGRAGMALAHVAEGYQPTVGFVSLAQHDANAYQGVAARRPEVPLAVLLGPRAVHDLKIDKDDLATRHDITVLGRQRHPSVLVRFSNPDAGLWAQLMAFGYDLGLERIHAASGIEGGTLHAD